MNPVRIDTLLEQSHDADPLRRRKAVRALCPCDVRSNRRDVWDRLFALARDEDEGVRRLVFHAMIDGSPHDRRAEVLETMERLAQDPSPRLARNARKRVAAYRRTGRVNLGH